MAGYGGTQPNPQPKVDLITICMGEGATYKSANNNITGLGNGGKQVVPTFGNKLILYIYLVNIHIYNSFCPDL